MQQVQHDQLQVHIDICGCRKLGLVRGPTQSAADTSRLAHLNGRSLNVWIAACYGLCQWGRQAGLHMGRPLLTPTCSCITSQLEESQGSGASTEVDQVYIYIVA